MPKSVVDLYAPFQLSLRAGALTLRILRDEDLPAYAELQSSRIFLEDEPYYAFEWLQKEPEERLRDSLQYLWSLRAIKPDDWCLSLGVWEGDRLVGLQDVRGRKFAMLRTVGSGSYLRADAQGRGIGTLMRQMMLTFAFDHLGALRADSGALVGNDRSLAVSKRCGYELDGTEILEHAGASAEMLRVKVTPETFVRPPVPVQVDGLTPELLAMLGADEAASR